MKSYVSGVGGAIITWTVIIACAFIIFMPCAVGHTRLIKFKSYAAYNIFSGCRNFCITFKVVPFLTDLYPAAEILTHIIIVVCAIVLIESDICCKAFGIIAFAANQSCTVLAEFIFMFTANFKLTLKLIYKRLISVCINIVCQNAQRVICGVTGDVNRTVILRGCCHACFRCGNKRESVI